MWLIWVNFFLQIVIFHKLFLVPDMVGHLHFVVVGCYQAHGALVVEEEATALSVWAIACICGSLRLENVSLWLI